MILEQLGELTTQSKPLREVEWEKPTPAPEEVLIKVSRCAVCHTELDEIEGRTPPPELPVILGHQVIGIITALGENVTVRTIGERVGVAWIYSACGECEYCRTGDENLCAKFQATGRDANGGYAEYMVAPAAFVYPVPMAFSDSEAAPLLCAGAIGYRSLRLSGLQNGQHLGLTGFGASAHLVLKLVQYRYPDSEIYVFARSAKERKFAIQLGAHWAGESSDTPPKPLHCIIDTTPAWKPIVEALRVLAPGGRLVINAIRKQQNDQDYLQKINYETHLWMEREIKSVANVARRDVSEFLALAAEIPIRPTCQEYPLSQANEALRELKQGHVRGAKVLCIE